MFLFSRKVFGLSEPVRIYEKRWVRCGYPAMHVAANLERNFRMARISSYPLNPTYRNLRLSVAIRWSRLLGVLTEVEAERVGDVRFTHRV